jgi:hypothetical protein
MKLFAIIFMVLFFSIRATAQEIEPVIPTINHQVEINPPTTVSRGRDASNGFGQSLMVDDDLLIVGSPMEVNHNNRAPYYGAAYVYRLVGQEWAFQQKIINPLSGPQNFGSAVAIENGRLAVGSWSYGVYFYDYDVVSGLWIQSDLILDEDDRWDDGYAGRIAWQNDVLVTNDLLEAHIYRDVAGVWTKEISVSGEPERPFDPRLFGDALEVSADGQIVIIGEPDLYTVDHTNPEGAAYIYRFDGGNWNLETKLIEIGAGAFGTGIDILGTGNDAVLAIGDSGIYGLDVDISGTVYLYSGNGWTRQHQISLAEDLTRDQFGASVQLVGQPQNAALIATAYPTINNSGQLPPARFFIFDVNTGQQIGEITSPADQDYDGDGVPNVDNFGASISIDGVGEFLKIAVGAPGATQTGGAKIYLFSHNPSPEELVNAGDFEPAPRALILNSWNTTPGAKLKCGRGVDLSCGVKFVSGIPSKITQSVDLTQFPLSPGDGLLFQMDAKVKGESAVKVKLKVIYADGFRAVVPLRIENTGGVFRRVMTAPAIFIANRPLDRIVISIKHTWLGGAAFLDNVSLVRVAGSAAR